MRIIKLLSNLIGTTFLLIGFNSAFAEQIQVTTSFTCESNEECKRKCEALGSDHTWKPNPGGSTWGTCTKRSRISLPPKATMDSLATITKHSDKIQKEVNYQFSKSEIAKRLGLKDARISSMSIMLQQKDDDRICASCLGDGFNIEMCCEINDSACVSPCYDGQPILAIE